MLRATRVIHRLLLLLTLGTVVSATAPVLAQPTDEELKEARKDFHRALELEQAGNWAGALRLFRDVSQVRMTPQVRFHIALCEENLGKLVAALGGYELALADAESVGGTFKEEVEENIDQLRARIPKLIIERGKGAEAAKIELDGIELGSSSIGVEVPIDPGPHQINASLKGYEEFSTNVTVDEEGVETLVVEMKKLPQARVQPTGSGTTQAVPPPAAKRELEVVPVALMGGGGAVMVTGGVLLLLAQVDFSDVSAQCPELKGCPDSLEPKLKRGKTKQALGFVSLGLGAAAAGTGLYLFLKKDPAKSDQAVGSWKKAGVRFYPSAPDSEAGVSILGRF